MKHWIGLTQLLNRKSPGGPSGAGDEMVVQMHYRNRSNPDVIRNFKVGEGSNFFLTFLEGGTVDLNLVNVREIMFENMVLHHGNDHTDIPTYQVRVSLTNGRALKGYSAGLYSFSGMREGTAWTYSCLGHTPGQVEARNNLARIVVRQKQAR